MIGSQQATFIVAPCLDLCHKQFRLQSLNKNFLFRTNMPTMQLTKITLLLKICCPLICLSTDSKKATVHNPPRVSKDMSTTMLSTRHFNSLTCSYQHLYNALACCTHSQHDLTCIFYDLCRHTSACMTCTSFTLKDAYGSRCSYSKTEQSLVVQLSLKELPLN